MASKHKRTDREQEAMWYAANLGHRAQESTLCALNQATRVLLHPHALVLHTQSYYYKIYKWAHTHFRLSRGVLPCVTFSFSICKKQRRVLTCCSEWHHTHDQQAYLGHVQVVEASFD